MLFFKKMAVVITVIVFILNATSIEAVEIGLGGGPESIFLKTTFQSKWGIEFRGDLNREVQIKTIRGFHRFFSNSIFSAYTGAGIGKISFNIVNEKKNNINGVGKKKEFFCGVETYLTENISIFNEYSQISFCLSEGERDKKGVWDWGFVFWF